MAKAKAKAGPQAERVDDSAAVPEILDAGRATYSVSLSSFEGPLDLLLHLCQKHELDILDIPISFVTEKYLEYLGLMQHMDLDVASEYLVMAATLAHIKSKMLLPAPPPGQEDDDLLEEEDPREALIRRLLEYQKYKQAGAELAARGVAGRDIFLRGATLEEAAAAQDELPPLAEIPLYSLLDAFNAVLARSKVKISHDVVADRISITDRIHELTDLLQTRRRMIFEELFHGLTTKFDLVITFLALLEMSRLRMTRLYQTDSLAPIHIEIAAPDAVANPHHVDHVDHAYEPERKQARGAAPSRDDADEARDDEAETGDAVSGGEPEDDGQSDEAQGQAKENEVPS